MKRVLAIVFVSVVFSSGNTALCEGTWTTFRDSTYNVFDMYVGEDYIWCATEGGIFQWDKQNPDVYRRLSVADGPIYKSVGSIFPHPDGSLWFSTRQNGILRYDGNNWRNLTTDDGLPNNSVHDFFIGQGGLLWFLSDGLVSFDGTEFTFYEIPFDQEFTDEGYSINQAFAQSDGSIICVSYYTRPYFFKFKDGEFSIMFEDLTFPWPAYISDCCASDTGEIFCSQFYDYYRGAGGGFSHFDGESWKHYYDTNSDLPSNNIQTIYLDDTGHVWVSTANGLTFYEQGEWHDTVYGSLKPNRIKQSPDGVVWFSEMEKLARYENGEFLIFTNEDGVLADGSREIAFDSNGDAWFGSDGFISSFNGAGFEHYRQSQMLEGIVHDIEAADDGSVWIATNILTRYNDGFIEIFTDIGYRIAVGPDNSLWALRYGGQLLRYDGDQWETHEDDTISGKEFASIDVDSNGVVWIGTVVMGQGTLVSFDGNEWKSYAVPDDYYSLIDAKADLNGNVWVLTYDVLLRFNGSEWFAVPEAGILRECLDVGPNGIVWVGSEYFGVSSFDGQSWTQYPWGAIQLAADKNVGVWLSSSPGLSHFDGETVTSYTEADGLADEYTNYLAVQPNGTLWVNTHGGLSMFEPSVGTFVESLPGTSHIAEITAITPNPFNPSAQIVFTIPHNGNTVISVYNILGQKVRTLIDSQLAEGSHNVTWNGCNDSGVAVSSGIYIVRLKQGSMTHSQNITLLR